MKRPLKAGMQPKSLKLRLILILLVLAPLVWLVATLGAYAVARQESNELFDTQQALFARQLLIAESADGSALPLAHAHKGDVAKFDDLVLGVHMEAHALGFAVRAANGRLLLADGEGDDFPPPGRRQGFVNQKVNGHHWRLFYLSAPNGGYSVAVGQSVAFRNRFALGLAFTQLLPWLAALPVLLVLMVLAVGRGLAPLRTLTDSIRRRRPDDSSPVSTPVPSEIQPLTAALNALFERVANALEHERRFTADAAHELRTPLAALRIQVEVLALVDDPARREHAIRQLMSGIERANRLVEQLLALSRLDPLTGPALHEPVSWRALAEQARDDVATLAEQRGAIIDIVGAAGPPLLGDATLLALLLRNLLDNALRYGAEGVHVQLELAASGVAVLDNGPGIAADQLERVRERFYRPPGQEQAGSGLGLSIVERIAALHGLALTLENRGAGGLAVRLQPAATAAAA